MGTGCLEIDGGLVMGHGRECQDGLYRPEMGRDVGERFTVAWKWEGRERQVPSGRDT